MNIDSIQVVMVLFLVPVATAFFSLDDCESSLSSIAHKIAFYNVVSGTVMTRSMNARRLVKNGARRIQIPIVK